MEILDKIFFEERQMCCSGDFFGIQPYYISCMRNNFFGILLSICVYVYSELDD
jgi:hypothetical protein